MSYDLVVVGGGPAGVTAALRAREMGAHVALVERGRLGGTCTNDGCVPTRVLAKSARLLRDTQQFASYGILWDQPPTLDFEQVMARTQQVVYTMHEKKQLLDHLRGVRVDTFDETGNAAFTDAHTMKTRRGETLRGDRFVLCVGGSARKLPLPGVEYTLTHSDVWTLKRLPASVVIVGAGATGCQLASIFEAFGANVTLMDAAPRILLSEDDLVASTMRAEFEARGIHVITGINGLERVTALDGSLLRLVYRHDGRVRTLDIEAVVLSVGWPGNVDALNLAAAGVETERGYIKVDDYLQTTAPHVYAAGDVTGKMMLVQSASAQARVAVENALLGPTRKAEHKLVPHGGFTDPEYGGVGLTEAQARQQGDPVVAVVPYADMDRAVIDGHTNGFCKLIASRETGRVLGAHVVGEQAVEVMQIVAAGMAGELTVDQIAELEFAYPTFAAVVGLAARQIGRELGRVKVAPEWRALRQIRGAEWERRD